MKKNLPIIICSIVVYILASGISYMIFSQNNKKVITVAPPTKSESGSLAFDQTLPKTEACPLNGVLYSVQQKQWWLKHRPLGVMIENHLDARPQSGLSYADVVYEAVAEGGITRFLALYYCQDAPEVGPIRSARTYFIDWLSEYGNFPLYAHVGGANAEGDADALGQIESYGWSDYNDLNQFSVGFPTYWRDATRQGHAVATEHTMYSTTSKLWDLGVSRSLTNVDKNGNPWDANFVAYDFKDDAASTNPSASKIHLELWSSDSDYFIDWTYDPKTNLYARVNGGNPHIDRNTNKQLTTKNLVLLSMQESHADDGYSNNEHLLYGDKGTGKAVVFMDGKKISATWHKINRTSRTLLTDSEGNAIKLNRGTIWFTVLPLNGVMDIK